MLFEHRVNLFLSTDEQDFTEFLATRLLFSKIRSISRQLKNRASALFLTSDITDFTDEGGGEASGL